MAMNKTEQAIYDRAIEVADKYSKVNEKVDNLKTFLRVYRDMSPNIIIRNFCNDIIKYLT